MTDRLAEIRARLDALPADRAWSTDPAAWALVINAPADIAYLLERESQMMGALAEVTNMALNCCDAAIGRKSLDECLRDFGLTLDEVEARDER